jgi:hypothetical protein
MRRVASRATPYETPSGYEIHARLATQGSYRNPGLECLTPSAYRKANPKSEYRNSKQIQNSNAKCSKRGRVTLRQSQRVELRFLSRFEPLHFRHLYLFRISIFDIRISDLTSAQPSRAPYAPPVGHAVKRNLKS